MYEYFVFLDSIDDDLVSFLIEKLIETSHLKFRNSIHIFMNKVRKRIEEKKDFYLVDKKGTTKKGRMLGDDCSLVLKTWPKFITIITPMIPEIENHNCIKLLYFFVRGCMTNAISLIASIRLYKTKELAEYLVDYALIMGSSLHTLMTLFAPENYFNPTLMMCAFQLPIGIERSYSSFGFGLGLFSSTPIEKSHQKNRGYITGQTNQQVGDQFNRLLYVSVVELENQIKFGIPEIERRKKVPDTVTSKYLFIIYY